MSLPPTTQVDKPLAGHCRTRFIFWPTQEGWWFAPSCRDEPLKCIPVTLGSESFMYETMQKAAVHGLPWALRLPDKNNGQNIDVQVRHRMLSQTNLPQFAGRERWETIQFPPFDLVQHQNGIVTGDFEPKDFWKLVRTLAIF